MLLRAPGLPSPARVFLGRLVDLHLLSYRSAESFLNARHGWLSDFTTPEKIGLALIHANLLTAYQLERILAGDTHGLVLGPYRIRNRIGQGGMGTVYQAEHALMKRRVAIKILPVDEDLHPSVRQRFYTEMRVLAELSHPNVVHALDAGEIHASDGLPGLVYLVMELIEGGDLDHHVARHGPCKVPEACNYIRQAAAGLQAAHDRHLIHRDIKPSNILLTHQGHAKLVDFGLARRFNNKLTDPRVLLGSIEFMAPEQSHDPSLVGKEADIYGLGATLFWLLTGEAPYPYVRHIGAALQMLQAEPPRRLRDLRPSVPMELDNLVARLLEREPSRRLPQPLNVMNALTRFLIDEKGVCLLNPMFTFGEGLTAVSASSAPRPGRRVLIVDDEESVCRLHRSILDKFGCECHDANDGESAVVVAARIPFDLVLLDLNLPGINGYEVCEQLRGIRGNPFMKILVVSGMGDQNTLSSTLPAGADDYMLKPFESKQLLAKAEHAFTLKDAQDRSELLSEQLLLTNQQLQQSLKSRDHDVQQAHNALLFTMAKMAESREGETPGHLCRLQAYVRVLARQAAEKPPWAGLVDDRFLAQLERCVALHDIGKIGLPADLLLKPGSLTPAERVIIQEHPLIGDRILEAVGREHGEAFDFITMARDIVRHHHERWDGKGYPDGLGGDAIPASARLAAIADVYDALRRQRLHKPAMSHSNAIRVMLSHSEGQFDPTLLEALKQCQKEFARLYEEIDN